MMDTNKNCTSTTSKEVGRKPLQTIEKPLLSAGFEKWMLHPGSGLVL